MRNRRVSFASPLTEPLANTRITHWFSITYNSPDEEKMTKGINHDA
jgi:hypothetical protein